MIFIYYSPIYNSRRNPADQQQQISGSDQISRSHQIRSVSSTDLQDQSFLANSKNTLGGVKQIRCVRGLKTAKEIGPEVKHMVKIRYTALKGHRSRPCLRASLGLIGKTEKAERQVKPIRFPHTAQHAVRENALPWGAFLRFSKW